MESEETSSIESESKDADEQEDGNSAFASVSVAKLSQYAEPKEIIPRAMLKRATIKRAQRASIRVIKMGRMRKSIK